MNPTLIQQIDEAIKYRDDQQAREILILATKDNQVQLSKADYLRLNYLRIGSLDLDRFIGLLKESVLIPYEIPQYDLEQKIVDYFELLEYPSIQVDFVYKIKAVLDQHQEMLGNQKINVNGQVVAPTIGNWILDYQSMVGSGAQDALGELKYINNGANLKGLTIPQRKILQNILKIYDRAAQLVELWEAIPDKLPDDEIQEFQEWMVKKMEEEYGTDSIQNNEPVNLEVPNVTPAVSQPVNSSKVTKLAPKPLSNVVNAPTPSMKAPAAPSPYKVPLQKGTDLTNQPKKGLVFDIPTNVDLEKEAIDRKKRQTEQAQREKAQQLKIQVKLEDLKNRNKSQK